MPTTNLSIGRDPVLDFDCSGWSGEKRNELSQAIMNINGVKDVGGAGISTVRVYYDSSVIEPPALTVAVDELADKILPGHDFSHGSNR